MRTGSTPVTRTKGRTMTQWFNWDNKRMELPGLWVLHDFLAPEIFNAIRQEIRDTPAEWHNRYQSREISEHGNYPLCWELAGRLIPYLHGLYGGNYKCSTVRAYRDYPGSNFFPHLDGAEFAVNFQLYMPATDLDHLGTQWCANPEHNQMAESNMDDLYAGKIPLNDKEFYTVPFRANWGYINLNAAPRRIHKTSATPENYIRESVHMNFSHKKWPVEFHMDAGLELNWYRQLGVAMPVEE